MRSSPHKTNKINVGVIGLGWWGPKLLRNILSHEKVDCVIGCDTDEKLRHSVSEQFNVSVIDNVLDLINNPSIHALVVATPPSTHYEIARLGLTKGKHILLTKPPTTKLSELKDLIKISEKNGSVLMLDSAFVFAPAIRKMKNMLGEKLFPTPTSVYSFRHGNDLHFHHIERLQNTMFKNGIDVVEDLLFHDLSLLTYLFKKKLHLKSIRRFYNLNPQLSDTAFVELETDHFPIHISLSWTLPERKRQVLLFNKQKYLLFDDIKETEKLNLFEFETKTETKIDYEEEEPLYCEVDHFINCIINGEKPLSDGTFMLQVMEIYEKIKQAKE
jgi:predicted dehydrogenase